MGLGARSSASPISARSLRARDWTDLGRQSRTLTALWNLCRRRHKWYYAVLPIMPVRLVSPLVAAAARAGGELAALAGVG